MCRTAAIATRRNSPPRPKRTSYARKREKRNKRNRSVWGERSHGKSNSESVGTTIINNNSSYLFGKLHIVFFLRNNFAWLATVRTTFLGRPCRGAILQGIQPCDLRRGSFSLRHRGGIHQRGESLLEHHIPVRPASLFGRKRRTIFTLGGLWVECIRIGDFDVRILVLGRPFSGDKGIRSIRSGSCRHVGVGRKVLEGDGRLKDRWINRSAVITKRAVQALEQVQRTKDRGRIPSSRRENQTKESWKIPTKNQ